MSDTYPRTFGRYELTSLLGEGGMGRVYRATLSGPSGFRKEVALKVIRPRGADRDEAVRAFIDEARLCGLLRHPNVVDVYDFGVTDGQPWLAMELVDGWPLDAILREHGALPPTVVLDVAIQVAEGLMHAHELADRGAPLALVHRDLKPGNVLVTRQGVAKVMDFGLARATAGEDSEASQVVRGTPAYMSPEQASGDALDPRSDLFSFGIMLYELAVGERPFLRENVIALMMALVQVEDALLDPEFLGRPDTAVPGLGPILRSCLRRDPADRFDRARLLVDALRGLLRRQPPGPSLRSWVEAAKLGGTTMSIELGALSVPAAALGASQGTGFAGTGDGPVRTNLAPDTDGFVGRESALGELDAAVDDGRRVITVVGPAGTGKTRLVRAFALRRLDGYLGAGGAWFCDLTPARDLHGVLASVAGPLGVPLERARGDDAAIDQLGFAIAGRGRVLVVLDNVEQVLADVVRVVERWAGIGGEAIFVLTSRERVRVAGGEEVELGPLGEDAALALFRERARAARPGWALTDADVPTVSRIVRKLDRIPLAVELAAARVAVLSPAQILQRLDQRFKLLRSRRRDRPERQATLEHAIAWSWELLDPDEQAALAQCSVFRGSFDLAAVEEVVELDGGWALDAIEGLRDKSLVRAEQVRELGGAIRFRLYESVREFAAGRLEGDGARRRHAEYFVHWGEGLAEGLDGEGGRGARKALSAELDNLHAAFARFAEGEPELAVRAVLVMSPILAVTGPLDGHVTLVERATELAVGHLRGRLLRVRGTMRGVRARFDEAAADLSEARRLAAEHADRREEGLCLAALGRLHTDRGELEQAGAVGEELAALAAAAADRALEAEALTLSGRIEGFRPGGFAEAAPKLERALMLNRELDRLPQAAAVLQALAVGCAQAARHGEASRYFTEALELHRELGGRRGQATSLANLGLLSLQVGALDRAQDQLRQARRMQERLGDRRTMGIVGVNLAIIEGLRGETEGAIRLARHAVEELGRHGSPYYQGVGWRTLGSLLHLAGELGEAERALARAEEVLGDEGWMIASAWACRGALAADRDALLEANQLLEKATEQVDRPEALSFVALCRGHADLAEARVYRDDVDPAEAARLAERAADRLARWGFDEAPPDGTAHEAAKRLAARVLQSALARYAAGGS